MSVSSSNLGQPSAISADALDALIEMVGPDETDFLLEIIDTFLADSKTAIDELHGIFDAGDGKALHLTAHSLKSTSATFGAMDLAALCASLEEALVDSEEDLAKVDLDIPHQFELISDEYIRVEAALQIEKQRLAG